MGAGPSRESALEALDDEQLIAIVQQAYQQDATRVDKILTLAKMRHLQSSAPVATNGEAVVASAVPEAAMPTPAVSNTMDTNPAATTVEQAPPPPPTASVLSATASASNDDRVAALWTFHGHTLRELRSGFTPKKRSAPGDDITAVSAAPATVNDRVSDVDADGYPVLYGSCGREKKYARCSVCYFRGVRCNTAHYCACCQRPVCVRPRTYPGEEHPKICWNVLHVDADMIQRVGKRRARKLLADKAVDAGEDEDVLQVRKSSSSDDQTDAMDPVPLKQRKTTLAGKNSTSSSPSNSTAMSVTTTPRKSGSIEI